MAVSSLTAQGSALYTPGDSAAPVRGLPQNPPHASLGMATGPMPTSLPVIGLVVVAVILLLLERRRLHMGGRR